MCMTTARYRNSIFVHAATLLHSMTAPDIVVLRVLLIISAFAVIKSVSILFQPATNMHHWSIYSGCSA